MNYLIALLFIVITLHVEAHDKQLKKSKYPINWHHLSYEKDSVYGAEIKKAYAFLKNETPKRRVVVAVIDNRCDINHEVLKDKIWVNHDEIAKNGIDDDENGYIDDINGWNFLGKSDGTSITKLSLEADRLFMILYNKYKNVDTLKLSKKDYTQYQYFEKELLKISPLCNAYKGLAFGESLPKYLRDFENEMLEMFPNQPFTYNNFVKIMASDEKDQDRIRAHFYVIMGWSRNQNETWEQVVQSVNKLSVVMKDKFTEQMNSFKDQRSLCGDDLSDIKSVNYGNNDLLSGKSDHATHIAGIIGAKRTKEIGIEGIADVELMILRVNGESGDEYDKDVALAIRYAVDNGANIINMSFGKDVSLNKKWVDDALLYADKKGVLMVHAAGNSFKSIDDNKSYPTKIIKKNKVIYNFINVGSISADGNPAISSNYGQKQVDLFAPGVEIYSSVSGNKYKMMSGTSMAAPVVTGVAALIWNYFPELSAKQVKDIILSSVTNRANVIVPQPRNPKVASVVTKIPFGTLCNTGGIVNAYNAVKKASEIKNK